VNKGLFIATRVRDAIKCNECEKPCCVFVSGKLQATEKKALQQTKEELLHTCGSPLFPEGSTLHQTLVVRESVTCGTPIDVQYYSGAVKFPDICIYCGHSENGPIKELKKQYSFTTILF
jgi:hypothetical protein